MSTQRLLLTEEQRSLVGAVRSLAKDKDFRGNSIKYMDGTCPWDNLHALARIGVLGMSIPEEYGGSNLPISRANEAEWFVVFTRINGAPGRDGIGCVLVNRNTTGFEVTARYHTMRGEYLAEIQFNNCDVPVENVVLREGGFKKLLSAFNTQRCLNPSVSLGMAEAAFEEAISYVRERRIRGQAVAEFQGIQWKLAEMYRDIEAGRSLLYRACLTANPFPDPHDAAIAKMFVNEMAVRVASEALQVHGGYGFTDEYPVSRIYPQTRYGSLGGGATEALKDLVGKKLVSDFDPVDGFLSQGTF